MRLPILIAANLRLVAPAAYHRVATGVDADEVVLNYTVRTMLLAESLIVLGLVGDAFITILMILEDQVLTIVPSILLAGFVMLLYVLPPDGAS